MAPRFRWTEAAGKLAPAPNPAKQAFVASFLLKCAAAGVTDPEGVAAMAEKVALFGDTLDTAGGKAIGYASLIPLAGLAAPPILGYAAGAAMGGAKNQMDTDDTKTLQLAAQANAYRRRAAEAKTQAEVRKLIASDPRKYVVLS